MLVTFDDLGGSARHLAIGRIAPLFYPTISEMVDLAAATLRSELKAEVTFHRFSVSRHSLAVCQDVSLVWPDFGDVAALIPCQESQLLSLKGVRPDYYMQRTMLPGVDRVMANCDAYWRRNVSLDMLQRRKLQDDADGWADCVGRLLWAKINTTAQAVADLVKARHVACHDEQTVRAFCMAQGVLFDVSDLGKPIPVFSRSLSRVTGSCW